MVGKEKLVEVGVAEVVGAAPKAKPVGAWLENMLGVSEDGSSDKASAKSGGSA